jgi:hypothetical protein
LGVIQWAKKPFECWSYMKRLIYNFEIKNVKNMRLFTDILEGIS